VRLFAVDEEPGRMRPTPPLKLPVGILLYVIREFLNHGRIAGTHVVGEQMSNGPSHRLPPNCDCSYSPQTASGRRSGGTICVRPAWA
jgi:hypothetical protein